MDESYTSINQKSLLKGNSLLVEVGKIHIFSAVSTYLGIYGVIC